MLILPKDQNLADFYADDFAAKLMPENYAEKLVKARVMSINHVSPILAERVKWPERERTIQLVGTRGEVVLGKGAGPPCSMRCRRITWPSATSCTAA